MGGAAALGRAAKRRNPDTTAGVRDTSGKGHKLLFSQRLFRELGPRVLDSWSPPSSDLRYCICVLGAHVPHDRLTVNETAGERGSEKTEAAGVAGPPGTSLPGLSEV